MDRKIRDGGHESSDQVILRVPDLSEAIDYFTRRLGFRIEMIVPADDPKLAIVSGQGITLRLGEAVSSNHPAGRPHNEDGPVISRSGAANAWHVGRAGMRYRDLIPGRMGGRFVASHIRIPDGGEVPDYVHYHQVRFQMIFCRAGWVRVVYEDQGPPFLLEAGDCVLQPPGIRHRVLEASPGLEVIELGSPAVHETWADHELELPTNRFSPERIFEGQRFVRHVAGRAGWTGWRFDGFESRDTGIEAATNGLAGVRVVRAATAVTTPPLTHAGELLFLYVLKGGLTVETPGSGIHDLHADDSCAIPAGIKFSLRADPDLEMLEVSLPARPSAEGS